MAIKNISSICKSSFILIIAVALTSCQTGPVQAPQNPQIQGPVTPTQQPTPAVSRTDVVSVPEFVAKKAPRVGLIFGPGGAKTWAQIGFLQEMEKHKIPVTAVAGLEWGAIVGSLYARHGQSNEVDWKLSQWPKMQFSSKNFFSEKMKAADKKDMDAFLQKIYAQYSLEKAKLPFACPYVRGSSGRVALLQRGSGATALKQCSYFAPLVSDLDDRAAPFAMAEAVSFVRSQGAELVILINVLESSERKIFRGWDSDEGVWMSWLSTIYNLRQAQHFGVNEVINVDTNSFAWTDFDQRLRLIQAGRQGSAFALGALVRKYDF